MKNIIQIICICLLFTASVSASSKGVKAVAPIPDSDKQTVELIINGDRYPVQNVNPTAQVDVYNIIGTKITSFQIKSGASDSSVSLPKGYYIIKIDDSTRKIAVK